MEVTGINRGAAMAVVRGLLDSGVKPRSVILWLPVILELIVTLGPYIIEIIKAIKDAIDGGATPATFNVPPAIES